MGYGDMNPVLHPLIGLLAQESVPVAAPTFVDVVGVPTALALFGLVLFVVLYRASLSKKQSFPLRHVGTVVIAIALVISLRTLFKLSDADTGRIYAAAINHPHTLYAHYAMPAVLALVLLGIGIAEGYLNKALPGSR